MIVAHIAGIPVEENLAALATAGVAIGATVTVARVRLSRLSTRLRRGLGVAGRPDSNEPDYHPGGHR